MGTTDLDLTEVFLRKTYTTDNNAYSHGSAFTVVNNGVGTGEATYDADSTGDFLTQEPEQGSSYLPSKSFKIDVTEGH